MIKQYEHLFFDLDHTLWDFDANSRVVLVKLYHSFDLASIINAPLITFIELFEARNEQLWDRYRKGFINRETLRWKRFWMTLLDFKIANEQLSHQLSVAYLEALPQQRLLLPHAAEVLAYCESKGYKMHIITNGFEATQFQKMEHAEIVQYFDQVITSEKSMSLKPHSAIFEYALQATQANLNQSIMIGDNWEVDIMGAHNFGMDQVFYNPQNTTTSGQATYTITCLSQLKEIL